MVEGAPGGVDTPLLALGTLGRGRESLPGRAWSPGTLEDVGFAQERRENGGCHGFAAGLGTPESGSPAAMKPGSAKGGGDLPPLSLGTPGEEGFQGRHDRICSGQHGDRLFWRSPPLLGPGYAGGRRAHCCRFSGGKGTMIVRELSREWSDRGKALRMMGLVNLSYMLRDDIGSYWLPEGEVVFLEKTREGAGICLSGEVVPISEVKRFLDQPLREFEFAPAMDNVMKSAA
ncbi:hypothetical protein MLD38_037154 [Melastoma candidum]|uniref:Uncharacterized protein n=2 Tax=Melastoma candidum TaxID=119954 RepID=A0ACB9LMD0_9MYRT|nr:hypothetical protein MLD38_037152 [Melastoma candidum]KAI4312337.1 hypothetical protein MLD38_037154 [Melastoma candidum]